MDGSSEWNSDDNDDADDDEEVEAEEGEEDDDDNDEEEEEEIDDEEAVEGEAEEDGDDDDEEKDGEEDVADGCVATKSEGISLHVSCLSSTGYKGVCLTGHTRYQAQYQGKVHIGCFDSAVEAAVAYAKYVQSLGGAGAEAQTREESVEAWGNDAEAAGADDEDDMDDQEEAMEVDGSVATASQGVSLHLSGKSSTGYKGVCWTQTGRYQAGTQRDGKHIHIGRFDTAVEAAVAYAKYVQSLGGAEVGGEVGEEVGEEEEQEEEQEPEEGAELVREAEGVRLHMATSKDSTTGYLGVRQRLNGRFQAEAKNHEYIGVFDTAVEAAVAYARHLSAEFAQDEAKDGGLVTEANGMTLKLSGKSNTGYTGVRALAGAEGRFEARIWSDGKHEYLGLFNTAVEAAVAYARHLQVNEHMEEAAGEKEEEQEEEEGAELVREAEGVRLHMATRKDSTTGYLGVRQKPNGRFEVDGKGHVYLGMFDTAVEAAVTYARHMKSEEDGKGEELATEAEGLQLKLSSKSNSGYQGVYGRGGRFEASHYLDYKRISLGVYATALEAAVAVARHLQTVASGTGGEGGGNGGTGGKDRGECGTGGEAAIDGDPEEHVARPTKRQRGTWLKRRVMTHFIDGRWYGGVVREYNDATGCHIVVYDDGEQRTHNIAEEVWSGTMRAEHEPAPVEEVAEHAEGVQAQEEAMEQVEAEEDPGWGAAETEVHKERETEMIMGVEVEVEEVEVEEDVSDNEQGHDELQQPLQQPQPPQAPQAPQPPQGPLPPQAPQPQQIPAGHKDEDEVEEKEEEQRQ